MFNTNESIQIAQFANIVRNILKNRGYEETVSPILRTFDSTVNPRFNVNDSTDRSIFFLRDCMETPLRKQVSESTPKIFEIGPCFRTDPPDLTHQQEFYMMELYSQHGSLEEMKDITKDIVNCITKRDVAVKYISLIDIICNEFNISCESANTNTLIKMILDKYHNISSAKKPYEIVSEYISIIEPLYLTEPNTLYFLENYPECTIDSAQNIENTFFIQRFEAYYGPVEIAHAFIDCLDSITILDRVVDCSTFDMEKAELISLVHKGILQPTAGLGIGINRLKLVKGDL